MRHHGSACVLGLGRDGRRESSQVVLGDRKVPEGTSIIFRNLCVSSGTTSILLKLQYFSGAVSQAAHRMGPELVCGH